MESHFFHFNSGNVVLGPHKTGVHMCIYCFPKSPLTHRYAKLLEKQFFLCMFEITAVLLFIMKKSKMWGAVAWPGPGKGPVASLPHEPCPSQCGDVPNHIVGLWPCPWRASTLFSLPSPCDGIIPAHLPHVWKHGNTQRSGEPTGDT